MNVLTQIQMETVITRRRLFGAGASMGAAAVAAACAPAAAPAPLPAPAAPAAAPAGNAASTWQREWDETVAAAKKEGKVVVATLSGTGYRQGIDAFQKAFPDITVEHTGVASFSALAPKI